MAETQNNQLDSLIIDMKLAEAAKLKSPIDMPKYEDLVKLTPTEAEIAAARNNYANFLDLLRKSDNKKGLVVTQTQPTINLVLAEIAKYLKATGIKNGLANIELPFVRYSDDRVLIERLLGAYNIRVGLIETAIQDAFTKQGWRYPKISTEGTTQTHRELHIKDEAAFQKALKTILPR